MAPVSHLHKLVQIQEIVVIPGQEHQIVAQRMNEVAGVRCTSQSDIRRKDDRMSRFAQETDQPTVRGVVVEVQGSWAGGAVEAEFSKPGVLTSPFRVQETLISHAVIDRL